jgi:hypothetical protein
MGSGDDGLAVDDCAGELTPDRQTGVTAAVDEITRNIDGELLPLTVT